MSSKVNVGDMEIHNLSAARFRERFKNIFEYDRALSEEDFDQILLEVDFNEGKALAKVVDRVRQVRYTIVSNLWMVNLTTS